MAKAERQLLSIMTIVGDYISDKPGAIYIYDLLSIIYERINVGTHIALIGVSTQSGKRNPAEEISQGILKGGS
jgi:hypothetical protein